MTVGGLPGTGTSTLCRLLSAQLGLPYVYAGQIFRDQASRRGMTLEEYNALAQRDPSVDRAIDEAQVELLRTGGVVLEGRLAGWLAWRFALPALKVWVTCEEGERLRRIVHRDGGDPQTQARLVADRVERERERYRRYYGVELDDLSIYDLVLDSTAAPPEDLARQVVAALGTLNPR